MAGSGGGMPQPYSGLHRYIDGAEGNTLPEARFNLGGLLSNPYSGSQYPMSTQYPTEQTFQPAYIPPPTPIVQPQNTQNNFQGSLWTDGEGKLLTWDQLPGGVRRHIETDNPTWYSDQFTRYGQ
jgi:hypothetical protein